MSEFKFPTEVIDLPSKGLVYPESSPLSKGTIELKYMSAKEEDILTNQNFLEKGIVVDKLLQSMIVSKIDYSELILGDKNAILVAARILGYGAEYPVEVTDKYGKKVSTTINLSELKDKKIDETLFIKGKNEFNFTLPQSKVTVTFKLLTHGDEGEIDQEIQGLKKIDPKGNFEVTARLRQMILSVNGDYSKKTIREFIEYGLLAKDSRALREFIGSISPGVDLNYNYVFDNGVVEDITIPIGTSFFWPDA